MADINELMCRILLNEEPPCALKNVDNSDAGLRNVVKFCNSIKEWDPRVLANKFELLLNQSEELPPMPSFKFCGVAAFAMENGYPCKNPTAKKMLLCYCCILIRRAHGTDHTLFGLALYNAMSLFEEDEEKTKSICLMIRGAMTKQNCCPDCGNASKKDVTMILRRIGQTLKKFHLEQAGKRPASSAPVTAEELTKERTPAPAEKQPRFDPPVAAATPAAEKFVLSSPGLYSSSPSQCTLEGRSQACPQPVFCVAESDFLVEARVLEDIRRGQAQRSYQILVLEKDMLTIANVADLKFFDEKFVQRREFYGIGTADDCTIQFPARKRGNPPVEEKKEVFARLSLPPVSRPQLAKNGGLRLSCCSKDPRYVLKIFGTPCNGTADLLPGMSFSIGTRNFMFRSWSAPENRPRDIRIHRLYQVDAETRKNVVPIAFLAKQGEVLFGTNRDFCAAIVVLDSPAPEILATLSYQESERRIIFTRSAVFDADEKKYKPCNMSEDVEVNKVFAFDEYHLYVIKECTIVGNA